MRLPVRLPQFGESAAEATVVAWLAQVGQPVKADQELVEVQTEKSLLTVSAPAAGVLIEHCVAPGGALAVGDVLALLEIEGLGPETATPAVAPAAAASATSAPLHEPTRRADGTERAQSVRGATGDHLYLSPRVRAQLDKYGLKPSDLATIPGSGAGGRLTARDVERYLTQGEPMNAVRQAVANSMARSWTRPLATIARPVAMDALLAHRRTIEGRPSATVYALRALALALVKHSTLACRLFGNRLLKSTSVDLAVAVEINDGVLTPVIRRCEALTLAQLCAAVDDVIAKGRAGRVSDAGDALSTVSNYGTFGITWATPIPLPGQASILGIGAVRNVPDWDPALKAWGRSREAELTLTFDHRIADGGDAGRLLNAVAELM